MSTTESTGSTPPWGDNFDAEKAWTLIQNLRTDKDTLQTKLTSTESERDALAKTAQEAEDAQKSDAQKLADRLAAAEKALGEKDRELAKTRVLAKHSIPEELADFLTGATEEELTAQAEKLATLAKPKEVEQEEEEEEKPTAADLPGKPAPALTPGHGGDEPKPFDPVAIALAARA